MKNIFMFLFLMLALSKTIFCMQEQDPTVPNTTLYTEIEQIQDDYFPIIKINPIRANPDQISYKDLLRYIYCLTNRDYMVEGFSKYLIDNKSEIVFLKNQTAKTIEDFQTNPEKFVSVLILDNCIFPDKNNLIAIRKKFNKVKTLIIVDCPGLDTEILDIFVRLFANLEFLIIRNVYSQITQAIFCNILANNRNLNFLDLKNCDINNFLLYDFAKYCTKLKSVILSVKTKKISEENIVNLIKNNINLNDIEISNSGIDPMKQIIRIYLNLSRRFLRTLYIE